MAFPIQAKTNDPLLAIEKIRAHMNSLKEARALICLHTIHALGLVMPISSDRISESSKIGNQNCQLLEARCTCSLTSRWQLNDARYYCLSWWRHQMETFSALQVLCAGNSPVTGEFPSQRPVTRSFHVFFDLLLNKRLSKQWWGWWFEPSGSL